MKWGYKRAFARCALLFAVGAALQFISGNINPYILRYPLGLILSINYIYVLILLSAKSDKWTWVRQLSDHHASVSSLASMLIMTLVFGLTRQDGSAEGISGLLGFSSMSTSWPFCILLLYFITVLGMRAIEEIRHWRRHPIMTTVIHASVFVVLTAAFFGCGDKAKVRIVAETGIPLHTGVSSQTGRLTTLPFMLTLEEFIMEEYEPEHILLPDGKTIIRQKGEPKMFLSRVKIEDRKGERHLEIKVNHPARIGAWRIYQMGYDKEKSTSTLECVKDGWYAVVQVGLWIILAAGAGMAFTAGYKRKKEERA